VRGRGKHRRFGAVETNLHGAGLYAGMFEHISEAHARPFGVSHGAVAPLSAVHARREESTAVAGSLAYRVDVDRFERLQFGKRELERLVDEPVNFDAERVDVDARGHTREVAAHEER